MVGDIERVLESLNSAGVQARALKVPLQDAFAWVVSLPDLIAPKS